MTTRRDLIARVEALEEQVAKLQASVKALKAAATRAASSSSAPDNTGHTAKGK